LLVKVKGLLGLFETQENQVVKRNIFLFQKVVLLSLIQYPKLFPLFSQDQSMLLHRV
jgi:hypothetical protein